MAITLRMLFKQPQFKNAGDFMALDRWVFWKLAKTNSGIHDMLASTVVVDLASQMIFDSPEDVLEYKTKIHEEEVKHAKYF